MRLRKKRYSVDTVTSQMLGGPLPWATWPWNRCTARLDKYEVPHPKDYHGRCDLKRHKMGDHALERGFDIIRWYSTQHMDSPDDLCPHI
jgi:hypothetical protein